MLKAFLQVLLFVLPWPLRRLALSWLFGFKISPTARIGLSLILVESCQLDDGARIGDLSLVKGLRELRIGAYGHLGNFNWVSGLPRASQDHYSHEPSRDPSLIIEEHAAITRFHRIDCTDRVTVGSFSIIAGMLSHILTHAPNFQLNRQSCAPVTIGSYCFIGTHCVLLKGARLPERSILAAGSVLSRAMTEPSMLYSGVPAVAARTMDTSRGYFVREHGFVE